MITEVEKEIIVAAMQEGYDLDAVTELVKSLRVTESTLGDLWNKAANKQHEENLKEYETKKEKFIKRVANYGR